MVMPTFTLRQLLEAGVHFGHATHRWNPKMKPYIFGVRNGIHIMDLQQTVPMLDRALQAVRETVAKGGRVLFVGTKKQASEAIAEAAKSCGQYYVNSRWLGGTLTNWKTITESVRRLRQIEEMLNDESIHLIKKERLNLSRQRDKLMVALGGIRDMAGLPDIMIAIDTNKESIAILEARKLGIPVVAVLDSNCEPDGITYPVPGNDDASRAIKFYCSLFAAAVIDGIKAEVANSGKDAGEDAEPQMEEALAESTSGSEDSSDPVLKASA